MAIKKIDQSFILPFIAGAIETLKTMCAMPVKPGKVFLKGDGPEVQTAIAGVLALSSKSFCGSLALCFPEATFIKIMNNMLGESNTVITDDMNDGASELLNMIFGLAKKVLSEKGHFIERAIPTVSTGANLKLRYLSSNPTFILPFAAAGTPGFQIEIVLEDDQASPAADGAA